MADGEPSRARVLIVDDDPETCAMSIEALAESYDVTSAATSEEAFVHVDQNVPDAIVVDVMLGVESGWELIRALQADPRCRALLIVVLSGHAPLESRPVCIPVQPICESPVGWPSFVRSSRSFSSLRHRAQL